MAPPVALPPAAAPEPATTPTTATPTPPPAAPTPSDGDDGSTSGLPLAPCASWQVPERSVWGPVPQGEKKSPVYAYFVCEFNKDGSGAVDPTRYICVHKNHIGHPVRVAHCKVTANLKQHLVGKHGVTVSSTHVGGHAAGGQRSGPRGGGPAVANASPSPRRGDRCSCQTRCTQTASHVLAARATSTYHLQTYHPQTHTSTIPCIIPCGWT